MIWVMIVGSILMWAGWIAVIAYATPKLDEVMIPHVAKVWGEDRWGVEPTDFSFYLSACVVAGLTLIPLLFISAIFL